MLKIKDDYDLNNLNKYGFKHEKDNEKIISIWDYWVLKLKNTEYYIETKNRIIDIENENKYNGYLYTLNLDILYDMIQDGIIEKESEA